LLSTGLLLGRSASSKEADLTPAERAALSTLSPLPALPPPDFTNRYADNEATAALGQMFFFDPSFSGPLTVGGELGKVGCVTCHNGPWLLDPRPAPTSLGSDWLVRNSPSLVNVAYYPNYWYENDGIFDSLWSNSTVGIELPPALNSSRLHLAHRLYEKYRSEYDAVFPPLDAALDPKHPEAVRFPADARPGASEWQAMKPADQQHVTSILANFGKAIHAYQRRLVSRDAPFDRFAAGDASALSPAAVRGYRLYIGKARCVQCHSGPDFADGQFYNLGLAVQGEKVVPPAGADAKAWPFGGREAAVDQLLGFEFNSDGPYSDDRKTGRLKGLKPGSPAAVGLWRTKTLRQIAVTAPYMRSGQLATLRDVIEFYNRGGDASGFLGTKDPRMVKLGLSDGEMNDLVAFFETLTGESAPARWLTRSAAKRSRSAADCGSEPSSTTCSTAARAWSSCTPRPSAA
jgi:cytochrome c peroxidase